VCISVTVVGNASKREDTPCDRWSGRVTSPAVAFGMGCFVFEVADQHRGVAWTYEEWRSEVEGALPNVATVSVTSPRQPRMNGWTPAVIPAESSGVPIAPFEPTIDYVIAFEMTIPKRMHPELLYGGRVLGSEKFS
jgi:hypothetical protein